MNRGRDKIGAFVACAVSALMLFTLFQAYRVSKKQAEAQKEITEHAPVQSIPAPQPTKTLTLPSDYNYDALDPHCARKLLAMLARYNEGTQELKEARFHAAWEACPEFRK